MIKIQGLHNKLQKLKRDFDHNPTSIHLEQEFNNIYRQICQIKKGGKDNYKNKLFTSLVSRNMPR